MGMNSEKIRQTIEDGRAVLGIEMGSTRIKAVLLGEDNEPIAAGGFGWQNSYVDGVWTYSLDQVWEGVQASYKAMADDVRSQYGIEVTKLGAIGFSGMMHGYLVFDESGDLLVPFRTWRNNITGEASKALTEHFEYPIPQRWSIAHLYQSILNGEEHVKDIRLLNTLASYVHLKLTGTSAVGIGEASGMFPIDLDKADFNKKMMDSFDELLSDKGYDWKLAEIMPKVLVAGENAGKLTAEGAKLLDPSGRLEAGCVLCPPEGDAGTGMVATNSVAERTGNVSAGTSVFALVVLEKELSKVHEELDLVTTPSGKLTALVHSNNCSSNLDSWVNLFGEAASALGMDVDATTLYRTLYTKALEGDTDCGGLMSYGYLSGEHMTHFEEGRPLFVRSSDSKFNLANFIRVNLYTALGALKIGLDILLEEEGVKLDGMLGHGGLFKTEGVGQRFMAAAVGAPVTVMETAGEGGAWGIGLLASYAVNKKDNETLEDFLNDKVFGAAQGVTLEPDAADVEGFARFMERYIAGLPVERAAVDHL